MKKAIILIILISILFIFGCTQTDEQINGSDSNVQIIGGDTDDHGCLIGAGYSWCPSTEKCQRMWEEYCEEYKSVYKGEAGAYVDISADGAKTLIESNPDLIIIDVSPNYANGHLPGSINYYIGDGSLDTAILTLDKDATYLVYCHSNSVSMLGAQKMIDAGFTNIYRLEGNYAAWVAAGYDIELPSVKTNESVTYSHPAFSGSDEKDCFDEICITRNDTQSVYSEGSVQWGCGTCDSSPTWYNEMDKNFQQNCVQDRMLNVIGKDLCLDTGVNKWSLVFESYSGGGESGEFSYTRTLFSAK